MSLTNPKTFPLFDHQKHLRERYNDFKTLNFNFYIPR